jgi:hypothetical protein
MKKKNKPQARELLFKQINSETILVGHSLENDLRGLRVVHRRVVVLFLMIEKYYFVIYLFLKTVPSKLLVF